MSDKMLALVNNRARATLIAALLMMSLITTGFVWAQKEINIVADGKKLVVNTLSNNPYKILDNAGIPLNPEDEIELSSKNVQDGTVIKVNRGVPITLIYQGETIDMVTAKTTLKDAVLQAGLPTENIRIEPGDYVRPSAGLDVKVITLSEQVVEKQVSEPYSIIKEPDSHLEKGTEHVTKNGENGLKKLDVKLYYEDGKEVRSETVSETVLVPVVNKVVRVGTRDMVETSRGAMRFKESRYMEATAYLPTDGDGRGITATGVRARWGIVAVDPRVIPLGTSVYIDGYGMALAADTGGAIKGNKIDLCMESLSEALKFGRRTVKVYILH